MTSTSIAKKLLAFLISFNVLAAPPVIWGYNAGVATISLAPKLCFQASGLCVDGSPSGGASIGGAVTGGTAGSLLFVNPNDILAQDNSNLFFDPSLKFLGVNLNGTAPQAVVDAGLAATQVITPVSNGTGLLEDLTSANTPPSSQNSFENPAGSGYTESGQTFCYQIYTYTILGGLNFGSGPASGTTCFTDNNTGAPFSADSTWAPGGGLNGQVIQQTSPSSIPENISAGANSFSDSNNMVANATIPLPVTSYAYHSDGSALNITYNVYSFKIFNGTTKVFAATPYAITITDPNDNGWYIPLIGWTTVPGVDGYRIIRSSDGNAIDVTSPSAFYDSSAFVSWSGSAIAVTPNSYVPPSFRAAGEVLQSAGNWAIHTNGTFNFANNIHSDSGGSLFTNGIFSTGLSTAGGNISLAGGTLQGGNISLGSFAFSSSGQMNIGGLTVYTGGSNMQFDVFGTGSKIGTAANQMIAFFGGTPHVQPIGNIITALGSSGLSLVASPVLPNPSAGALGGVISKPTNTNQWLDGISTAGIVTASQPAFSNISGTLLTSQLANPATAFLVGFTGAITSIVSNGIIGYGKIARTITLQSIQSAVYAYTCAAGPTITLIDCGTSVGNCSSGTTNKAAVSPTAAGGFDGSIINAGIAAGHYYAFELTAGTCAALNASVSVEYIMQ